MFEVFKEDEIKRWKTVFEMIRYCMALSLGDSYNLVSRIHISIVGHINVFSDMQSNWLGTLQYAQCIVHRETRARERRRENFRDFYRIFRTNCTTISLWMNTSRSFNRVIINVTNHTLDTLSIESSFSHSTIALALT